MPHMPQMPLAEKGKLPAGMSDDKNGNQSKQAPNQKDIMSKARGQHITGPAKKSYEQTGGSNTKLTKLGR